MENFLMLTIRQIYQKNYPMGKQLFYTYTSEKYYHLTSDAWNNQVDSSFTLGSIQNPPVNC